MKTIYLPAGTTHVRFDEIPALCADALWPDDGSMDELLFAATNGGAQINLKAELKQAVTMQQLQVKDPLTFGPHSFPLGQALKSALVTVDGLRTYLDGRCAVVVGDTPEKTDTQPQAETAQSEQGSPAETPRHVLATPTELIDAFGKFTGMNETWFNNVKDTPRLMAARHTAGKSGRNGREPLYLVFPVMQWLIDPKRRKGKSMEEASGWRILKNKFPKVYEEFREQEPGND